MLRCALAEWQLARTRLVRSRLGLWLLLLVAGFVLVARHPVILALDTGMLAAVLAIAFTAGADSDRAALALTLTHPTTPLAVALGRWLAASAIAGLCVGVECATRAGSGGAEAAALWRAAAGGLVAAAATAACALAAVWAGGNALAGVLFLYVFVISHFGPPAIDAVLGDGVVAWIAGAVLQVLPGVWRYAKLAYGDPGAWAHAVAWAAGGVSAAGLALARWMRR